MAGNNDTEGCAWTPFGRVMTKHWKRIGWDLVHLFSTKDNPYNDKAAMLGIMDLSHAILNIPVEYNRSCPHRSGHFHFYVIILLLIVAVIGWIL